MVSMIRAFLPLTAMLGGVPMLRAQTRSFQVHPFVVRPSQSTGVRPNAIGRSAQNALRIPVPRINVRPVAPGTFFGRNEVNPYPGGYVLTTVRQSPVPQPQHLSNDPDPTDHLNGVLLSRNPRAQANQLNFAARADVRYSNRLVAEVQQDLRRSGDYAGSVDGSLGPETETAIQRYQLAHHQPVTGLLDRALLSQLGVVTPSR
jgi:peptidoglycan hydrolase-like protein with peptidoglycan-binding domain